MITKEQEKQLLAKIIQLIEKRDDVVIAACSGSMGRLSTPEECAAAILDMLKEG